MTLEGIPRPFVEEEFQTVLDEGHDTVAVVSQPWSGRSQLLDTAVESFDVDCTPISLDAPVDADFSLPAEGVVILENCQHLFQRRIGGFDTIEEGIEAVVTRDDPVVMGWNSFAWEYLVELTDIYQAIDAVYEIEPLNVAAANSLLTETLAVDDPETMLSEVADAEQTKAETDGLIRLRTAIRNRYRGSVVESHLEGLVSDAGGNPTAIHQLFQARTDPDTDARPNGFDLSYNEAYVLWVVLAAGETTVQAVNETTADAVSLALTRLERQGAIERTADRVSVRPLAFEPVCADLSRRRLLW